MFNNCRTPCWKLKAENWVSVNLYWSQLTSMVEVFSRAIWSSLVSSRKPGSCLAKSTISWTDMMASSVKWANRCWRTSLFCGSWLCGQGLMNAQRWQIGRILIWTLNKCSLMKLNQYLTLPTSGFPHFFWKLLKMCQWHCLTTQSKSQTSITTVWNVITSAARCSVLNGV